MNKTYETLGYTTILKQMSEFANSRQAKGMILEMKPFLVESELRKHLRDTTQARKMLDLAGVPPIPSMDGVEELILKAVKGDMLFPEDLEKIGSFLAAVRRLGDYLRKGVEQQIGIAFYRENLTPMEDLEEVIGNAIRNGRIDDYASGTLRDIRRELVMLEEKIKAKAEALMKSQKNCMAENFIVTRNGRICLPVKKEYKGKIQGAVVDRSATGSTLFIEPEQVGRLKEEYDLAKLAEDSEERRILYEITGMAADREEIFLENMKTVIKLDFIFAKGRMSLEMNGAEPVINTDRRIRIAKGRHPMIRKEECVPLDFAIGGTNRGVIITGPNTGGKTVAIKTVGLLSLMACSGLHVPCESADICMNCQVLCDIGDGQNIEDNLSTFSAHVTRILEILKRVNRESLIILDELGSGTDPAEGMGIAIAILEQLRMSGCLFLVTTHYPEVKAYAEKHEEIINARMAFDRENLKPLYRLEIGETGESCALYIAKRLGMPDDMIAEAAKAAYGNQAEGLTDQTLPELTGRSRLEKVKVSGIKKMEVKTDLVQRPGLFRRGDSVAVLPDGKIGIVVKEEDAQGNVLVQIQKVKQLYNHKRLKLKVKASELYPEDYDFSIIFDTVENRKARHKMGKGHQEGLVITVEE
ncbi:DNA mismatch repair protein MutS [Clostridium sp. MCC353]|uniref:endonuclease MutS2 n=1 Tax=Clostridium sp. MCC353 TaxID=2592646 RepID=UPI001C01B1F5|nr:DNA mismatch repair protein MutS [Clostridium sp. MCC353]MBT9776670.1 DNA mismatch repair protein MutS [Clostridium sp. MCC353]